LKDPGKPAHRTVRASRDRIQSGTTPPECESINAAGGESFPREKKGPPSSDGACEVCPGVSFEALLTPLALTVPHDWKLMLTLEG
jgi:hypothetical protein